MHYLMILIFILLIFKIQASQSSFVFHENTKIMFQPDVSTAEFFGYSALLSPSDGLLVGAPKAEDSLSYSRIIQRGTIKPGVVFSCSLEDLNVKQVNCSQLGKYDSTRLRRRTSDTLVDDMWFGANMVSLPNDRIMINAPRWTSPYGRNHMLMNGISFCKSRSMFTSFYLLRPLNHQAFLANGVRREYGEYGTHLNFYAYGQAGMSAVVTKRNTVLLGAPGLLQWTGGILSIQFSPSNPYLQLSTIVNPYYTRDLGPDEYFGYSVESGVFTKTGEVLYVAGAPRHNIGSGQVLVFEPPANESTPLNVRAKIKGPQSGAYFGYSLSCTDINGDGFDDLLVGAPTFVKKDGGQPYDQGAVFVYMTKENDNGFVLEESGYVTGSAKNAAWFGIAVADLGDIDGDGFKDIAVGAPWEDDGRGAVYIYKGYPHGLKTTNVQRIQPEGAKGFGWAISKGADIDENNCNDLVIGAHISQTTYLYRCIPTMPVNAVIKVPDAINLPQNTSEFTAVFCVVASLMTFWPHVEMNIKASIEVDPENNRAILTGDSNYTVHITPGNEACNEHTIEVNPTADLSKPISLVFRLEPDEIMKENSTSFLKNAARLSDESILEALFLIQMVRDCGEDLICTPWLVMTLEALDNPYIPGSNTTLGVRITVLNQEEPAYGGKVNITLPMPPKRIPSECTLKELDMICDIPAPFIRDEQIVWEIELDYYTNHVENKTKDLTLNVEAKLSDPLYRNVTNDALKNIVIDVTPEANFSVNGKAMPNASMAVSRENLAARTKLAFTHLYQVTNLGPSDWSDLTVQIILPPRINISVNISGCEKANTTDADNSYECVWSVPAMVSLPISVPLALDFNEEEYFPESNVTYNATTHIIVQTKHDFVEAAVTTTFVLEPKRVTLQLILLCVSLGLLILGIIVYIMYKYGFFKRKTLKMMQQEAEQEENLGLTPNPDDDDEYPCFSDDEDE